MHELGILGIGKAVAVKQQHDSSIGSLGWPVLKEVLNKAHVKPLRTDVELPSRSLLQGPLINNMSHLTGSSDSSTTHGWTKIMLDSGDPLYFLFDKSGTTVKVSNRGLLGKRVFKGNAATSLYVGESLWAIYQHRAKHAFANYRESQRGFIVAALCSDSVESFAEKVSATRYASRVQDLAHV
ncbi:MAG: hypothetical protein O3A95_04545 [Planctomycetota bacterium]|nr:hypothetical protein [Planctomycetota bacterium]MDA1113554.1 hypothetical protein [Planctomycetota bacterium]